jgi:hypothetical protein
MMLSAMNQSGGNAGGRIGEIDGSEQATISRAAQESRDRREGECARFPVEKICARN